MPSNISPISYTNKDFRSIYEELLNLAKELSYKWDPTISNESDPGVVLLKLNAIIGDKNNYNIDKNILEAFPETVTQEVTARQLFNQLGYKMPWYKGANTDINIKWIGRELVMGETVTIPRYTMITNEESDVVYTLTTDAQINYNTKENTTTVPAIQGNIVHYTVSGNRNITSNNFDKLNRLYLNDYNVAENGIFISNITDPSIEWVQVDNLQLYPVGSYVYEFNVDSRTNTCYLEFPEDFDTLIGSGITLSYITTQGYNGNVKSRNLTKFLNEIAIKLSGEEITLNDECIEMYNNKAANDGSDPQDIDGAYRSYKKVVGTFDTLVTLRDYINAAINSGLVSNGVVSDRLNDVQTTYSVVTTTSDMLNTEIMQEQLDTDQCFEYVKVWPSNKKPVYADNTYYEHTDTGMSLINNSTTFNTYLEDEDESPNIYVLKSTGEEDLTAYDLRMYLLHNVNQITNISDYNKTFENVKSNDVVMNNMISHIQNLQCVQHDFKDILEDRYCMFKTVYPLNIKVVPQYKLSDTQINTLKNNVFEALRNLLQSKNVDFGSEPDYDIIYNTISLADNRIKFIILDDFKYTTYAVYWDGTEFKEIPISEFNADNIVIGDTFENLQQELISHKNKYGSCNCYFINKSDYKCYVSSGSQLVEYSDKIKTFRTELIAKSVLAGITSLFNVDNRFIYSLSKVPYIPSVGTGGTGGSVTTGSAVHDNISSVSTKLIICPFGTQGEGIKVNESITPGNAITGDLSFDTNPTNNNPAVTFTSLRTVEELSTSYTLNDNESLRFFGPSFKTETSYSNYVKFVLVMNNATGFEYRVADLSTENPISVYNPVYLYQFDSHTGKYIYKEYTTDCTVTDSNNKQGTISELSKSGTLQVFRRTPSYIIPAEHDYKLREDDMLIFFWREKQEDDSPYTFKVYRGIDENKGLKDKKGNLLKSPVINATFTIVGTNVSECKVPLSQLGIIGTNIDSGTINHSIAINSAYYQVSKLYGDNDLSGSKTIDIKVQNEITLNTEVSKSPYYYFVTKDVREDEQEKIEYYYMTFKSNDFFYVLEEDEYFIQINSTKTAYEIYGPGTMIKLKTSTTDDITLQVEKIEYESIVNNGISELEKHCKLVSDENTIDDITIREQQMYVLTGGDTIYMTLNEGYFNKESTQENISSTNDTFNNIPYKKVHDNILTSTIKLQCGENSVNYSVVKLDNTQVSTAETGIYVLPQCVINTCTKVSQTQENDNKFKYCLVTSGESYGIIPENIGQNIFASTFDSSSLNSQFLKYDSGTNKKFDTDYYLVVRNDGETNFDTTKGTYCTETSGKSGTIYTATTNSNALYFIYTDKKYRVYKDNTFYKFTTTKYELVTTAPEELNTSSSFYVPYFDIIYVITSENKDDLEGSENLYIINNSISGLDSNDYELTYEYAQDTNTPVLSSDTYEDVSGIDITFTTSTDEKTVQTLPVTNVGSNDGNWICTARLDVQSSATTPQKITPIDSNKSAQFYFIHTEDGVVPYFVTDNNNKNLYISSNVEVSKVGGNNIDVSYLDLLGNRHGIDLYIYEDNDLNNTNISVNENGSLNLNMSKVNDTYTIPLKLESGYKYILPIQNNSIDGRFKVTVSDNVSNNDDNYKLHDFNVEYGNGKYYFLISDTATELEIEITQSENTPLTLLPLIKYKDDDTFPKKYDITVKEIIEKMQLLDKDKKFRYDYIVPQDKLITDPLLSKEFFNSNHIYNKYNISKANLDTSRTPDNTKVLPNNSEIVIVSNR